MGSNQEIVPVATLDEYAQVPDAAKILGKCTRSIKRYISGGVLRARRFKGQGRAWWIRKTDLEALKNLQDWKLGTADLWDLLKTIKIRLHSIEKNIDFLMHVNGLDVSSLRDAPTEHLMFLYEEVCHYLDMKKTRDVETAIMVKWAEVLIQVTEVELERLVGPTQNVEPWRPFYDMCRLFMSELRKRKSFPHSGPMQHAYRLLDKARKSIGIAIVVFTESRAADIGPRKMSRLYHLEVTSDSLTRYIAAEFPKSTIK